MQFSGQEFWIGFPLSPVEQLGNEQIQLSAGKLGDEGPEYPSRFRVKVTPALPVPLVQLDRCIQVTAQDFRIATNESRACRTGRHQVPARIACRVGDDKLVGEQIVFQRVRRVVAKDGCYLESQQGDLEIIETPPAEGVRTEFLAAMLAEQERREQHDQQQTECGQKTEQPVHPVLFLRARCRKVHVFIHFSLRSTAIRHFSSAWPKAGLLTAPSLTYCNVVRWIRSSVAGSVDLWRDENASQFPTDGTAIVKRVRAIPARVGSRQFARGAVCRRRAVATATQ